MLFLDPEALGGERLAEVASDIVLLNSLGVKLVLAYGPSLLEAPVNASANLDAKKVTSAEDVRTLVRALGATTADLSARLAASYPDSPAEKQELISISGNFIKARPVGIVDGIDYQLAGRVRKVNHRAIRHMLDHQAIVLIPSTGASPSGETFRLDPCEIAREVACALDADKLIFMTPKAGLLSPNGQLINEIDLSHFSEDQIAAEPTGRQLLNHCDIACKNGVKRCHIISFSNDGALIEELFTRDGCGTQIVGHSYEQIRKATIDDVPGILRLIEPLETSGVLVKRSRELLESEIDRFIVIDRDGLLISCAALYTFGHDGELACLVTHPDYRNGDRGDRLLDNIEKLARQQGLKQLFVLTTQSAHWFTERGFKSSAPDELPAAKKDFYNYQRNSSILFKQLNKT